jgi:DNA-binding response OmpR family regulator
MISCCPRCGADLEALHSFEVGELRVEYDGSIILWKGQRVTLRPSATLVLLAILRAGGVPVKRWVLAEAAGYEGDNADNIAAIYLCQINAAFRAIDPGFAMIQNVRSQGLRWRVEDA